MKNGQWMMDNDVLAVGVRAASCSVMVAHGCRRRSANGRTRKCEWNYNGDDQPLSSM